MHAIIRCVEPLDARQPSGAVAPCRVDFVGRCEAARQQLAVVCAQLAANNQQSFEWRTTASKSGRFNAPRAHRRQLQNSLSTRICIFDLKRSKRRHVQDDFLLIDRLEMFASCEHSKAKRRILERHRRVVDDKNAQSLLVVQILEENERRIVGKRAL